MDFFHASPEFQLLLTCAQSVVKQNLGAPGFNGRGLDWNKVAQIASQHCLSAILSHSLKDCATNVPNDTLVQLEQHHRANARWNLYLTKELVGLLASFDAQKIPVLAFKGPVMAQQFYAQLTLREMTDLDLLVHPEAAARAIAFLETQGFEPQFRLSSERLARFICLRQELMFWHPGKELPLDLHWNPLPLGFSFTPAGDGCWENTATVSLAGREIKTLSAENQLLYLCAHHAKDNWPRLRAVVDLAALLARFPSLDWALVLSRAGHFGSHRMLRLGLLLTTNLMQLSLPPAVAKWAGEDPAAARLAATVIQRLLDDHAPARPAGDVIYRKCMDSSRDRLWYWIDRVLLPTPLEWDLVKLPDWLYPLYYPVRLGRLLAKHGKNYSL